MNNKNTTYEDFVAKFEPKKTTDDCYTPKIVYDTVLDYVGSKVDLGKNKIVRPFYPNGDYQKVNYKNSIVIDNPPFSIFTQIVRFFCERNIKFFLFAPHLTILQAFNNNDKDLTAIITGSLIEYENGAKVRTSFVSNLFGSVRIMSEPNLHKKLEAINAKNKANLPKYEYPAHVLTVSKLQKLTENGIKISIDKKDSVFYKELVCQKNHDKQIFGGGFLVSDKVAKQTQTAEKSIQNAPKQVQVWTLSDKEKAIIKNLGKS